MKLDKPKNINYAATVVAVPATIDLPGLDNLVGVPVLGHQALTAKGVGIGDLRVAFTAETQLSQEYASTNNLHRESELNRENTEKGYLEKNRRIRAMKMRGHVSNALLMPLDSLVFTDVDVTQLREGDTFDTLNGVPICQKYEIPTRHGSPTRSKVEKAFKRVDRQVFPEHLDTDAYWRSKQLLDDTREIVVTQKLHGTSWRGGNVPVLRQLSWLERLAKKLGVRVADHEHDVVFGSRKVIKDVNNPHQDHFYDTDIWTDYGRRLQELIPEGYMVYGELVGWVSHNKPIQKNYTYHLKPGEAELFVYRVATVNRHGVLSDLPWDGVKEFCRPRGLKWAPELGRITPAVGSADVAIDILMNKRYSEEDYGWAETPLPLSHPKTVDEGVCLRQEGQVPLILKAKSPVFLEHETKLLDSGEVDLESEGG